MLVEKKTRILCEDDVIKAVDKHTNEDGTLDNGISCILEEVKSVVIMGSKEAMSKIKANEPKYDFHVGDYVEDIDGNIGYIDFICDCDKCKERGFNEPRIHYTSGETDYITVCQLEHLDKSYKRIGKYEFKKKTPIIKSIDSIYEEDYIQLSDEAKQLISEISKLGKDLADNTIGVYFYDYTCDEKISFELDGGNDLEGLSIESKVTLRDDQGWRWDREKQENRVIESLTRFKDILIKVQNGELDLSKPRKVWDNNSLKWHNGTRTQQKFYDYELYC